MARRRRALSRKEYLNSLPSPSRTEIQHISAVQLEKEHLINEKYHYHDHEEEAATKIQKAYRGHRERRQLDGMTLDPSARWTEAIREVRYRVATTQHISSDLGRPRSASRLAAWERATKIAAHAGAGESPPSSPGRPDLPMHHQIPDTMTMDMRYFLEMVDPKHRYGANLQIYHEEWVHSQSNHNFLYWLDHGEGKYVTLPLCDRVKLEREQIRYLSREERKDYLVRVDDDGKLRWARDDQLITTSADLYKDTMHGIVPKDADGIPFTDDSVKQELSQQRRFVRKLARLDLGQKLTDNESDSDSSSEDSSTSASPNALEQTLAHTTNSSDHTPQHHRLRVSPATILNHLLRASIKPGTWIYVADTVGRLYVGIKSSGSFQHASFLAGARISSAGAIGIANGQLTYLSPLSGHYRPTTKSFRVFLDALRTQHVDMRHLRVSSAYRVLLGMELYGRTKRGLRHRKVQSQQRQSEEPDDPLLHLSAVALVQQHWEEDHTR